MTKNEPNTVQAPKSQNLGVNKYWTQNDQNQLALTQKVDSAKMYK